MDSPIKQEELIYPVSKPQEDVDQMTPTNTVWGEYTSL